jgi:hypothetical protein
MLKSLLTEGLFIRESLEGDGVAPANARDGTKEHLGFLITASLDGMKDTVSSGCADVGGLGLASRTSRTDACVNLGTAETMGLAGKGNSGDG